MKIEFVLNLKETKMLYYAKHQEHCDYLTFNDYCRRILTDELKRTDREKTIREDYQAVCV